MFGTCTETVSILEAMIFGAGDACVMLSTSSILTAFAAFIVLVLIAQFIARRLWAKLMQPSTPLSDFEYDLIDEPTIDRPFSDDPNYQNSAIRSTRR